MESYGVMVLRVQEVLVPSRFVLLLVHLRELVEGHCSWRANMHNGLLGLNIRSARILDTSYFCYGFVLGCIAADLFEEALIVQHVSRSTRFAFFCTAPIPAISQIVVKLLMILSANFAEKRGSFLINFDVFRTDVDDS